MKTDEQVRKAAAVVLRLMSKSDREIVATICKVPELARENYAVNIWSGVVSRHAVRIAKETAGEVVLSRPADFEQVAAFLFSNSQVDEVV